jgi:Short-chain alcohol dehydrogenase of unknown specificity
MTPPAPSPLSGAHALVTGASGGIGSAIALALAAAGARVSIAGRKAAALASLADRLGPSMGAEASFDVTDEAASAPPSARSAPRPVPSGSSSTMPAMREAPLSSAPMLSSGRRCWPSI